MWCVHIKKMVYQYHQTEIKVVTKCMIVKKGSKMIILSFWDTNVNNSNNQQLQTMAQSTNTYQCICA